MYNLCGGGRLTSSLAHRLVVLKARPNQHSLFLASQSQLQCPTRHARASEIITINHQLAICTLLKAQRQCHILSLFISGATKVAQTKGSPPVTNVPQQRRIPLVSFHPPISYTRRTRIITIHSNQSYLSKLKYI